MIPSEEIVHYAADHNGAGSNRNNNGEGLLRTLFFNDEQKVRYTGDKKDRDDHRHDQLQMIHQAGIRHFFQHRYPRLAPYEAHDQRFGKLRRQPQKPPDNGRGKILHQSQQANFFHEKKSQRAHDKKRQRLPEKHQGPVGRLGYDIS